MCTAARIRSRCQRRRWQLLYKNRRHAHWHQQLTENAKVGRRVVSAASACRAESSTVQKKAHTHVEKVSRCACRHLTGLPTFTKKGSCMGKDGFHRDTPATVTSCITNWPPVHRTSARRQHPDLTALVMQPSRWLFMQASRVACQ